MPYEADRKATLAKRPKFMHPATPCVAARGPSEETKTGPREPSELRVKASERDPYATSTKTRFLQDVPSKNTIFGRPRDPENGLKALQTEAGATEKQFLQHSKIGT